MKIKATAGTDDVAMVYIAEMDNGKLVEFVESVQPPIPRHKKWVLIVSSLYGCPVGCRFCDAGEYYSGKLSKDEILAQTDYMIDQRFPDRKVLVEKFKIQFARMGEPAFNPSVIDALEELPVRYDAPGLLPTLSTTAPKSNARFFDRLLTVKKELYNDRFQLQFSIHSTDVSLRDWLIPVKKWGFGQIAEYGEAFYHNSGRKITLNFALADGMTIDPDVLLSHFTPEKFLVKITPVNPTYRASMHDISSHIQPDIEKYDIIDRLKSAGYDVILSIGELRENLIGSNCGQYITNFQKGEKTVEGGYTYPLHEVS
ncbi:radical SAM protein [Candidatus Latescibacterota bacterium]